MNVFDFTSPLPEEARQAVVAIGNFDAVHSGHRSLLSKAKAIALEKKGPLAVLTFEPHPRRLFRPDDAPFRITPLSVKLDVLASCGVDIVYVLPFDWSVAKKSAQDFIDTILKAQLNPVCVVVGHDFHFGHNRSGTITLLKENNVDVVSATLLADEQHGTISATRVRGLIQSGHMREANQLLGWDWEMRGVVEKGDQRGRLLGYPTANIPLGETIHPAYGVYATMVQIEGETQWRMAATNIGIRPMFEVKTALIEAHIMDYAGDLYGKILRVRPVKKIRDEMKFGSLESLIEQIEKDCQESRTILTAKASCESSGYDTL